MLGHHRPASETPMMARLLWYLDPPSNKNNKIKTLSKFSDKTFWNHAWGLALFGQKPRRKASFLVSRPRSCRLTMLPCIQDYFALCLLFLSSDDLFSKSTFLKTYFRNTASVSNSLDPDQARPYVGPDLVPNCLQRLSADDTSR